VRQAIKRIMREYDHQLARWPRTLCAPRPRPRVTGGARLRTELDMRDDNIELHEKRQAALRARQEERARQGREGNYGDLVWVVVAARVQEAETFVA